MTTPDWPTIDPSDDSDHHSDLFTGDIFGDELLDIYNTSVPATEDQQVQKGNDNTTVDYDGGLGALGHSTSICDFTSILEDNNTVLPSPTKITEMEQISMVPSQHPAADAPAQSAASNAGCGKKRVRDTTPNLCMSESTLNPPPSKKKTPDKSLAPAVLTASAVQNRMSIKVETQVEQKDSLANNATVVKRNAQEKPAVVVVETVPSAQIQVAEAPPVVTTPVAPGVGKSTPALIPPTQTPISKGNHIVANAAKVVHSIQTKEIAGVGANFLKTEESFKGVAQAAVTNLILSAGNTVQRPKEEDDPTFVKPVDTSTAHVAALTSNNWVAACAASISGAPPGTAQAAQAAALAAASDPAAAKAARARRATLTADERARQNRDRNREHARNTRLRKKAYVEELKRTLTELVTQRDAAEVEKRHEKQRDLEVREVRYRVMEEFLKLRARGSEHNLLARWIAILEDGFVLTLPKTDYRSIVQNDAPILSSTVSIDDTSASGAQTVPIVDPTVQVLHNASQCFDDASKLASFMTSSVFMGSSVQMTYHCERSQFMMDGVRALLDWTLKVSPQTQSSQYNATGLVLKGSMKATFSPASNKLASAELIFDTGNVQKQIKALKSQQTLCPIEETDALLDSVLPQVSTISPNVNQRTALPSSASVVSTERDVSSDEEGVVTKSEA